MKRILSIVLSSITALVSIAQTEVTVSTGSGYTDQVWYSLENGEQARNPLAEWDIAFSIPNTARDLGSIIVNDGARFKLYVVPGVSPSAFVDVDTSGIDSWQVVYNSDTTWTMGAFNKLNGVNGQFDYSFGNYSMVTHSLEASRVFVLKYTDNTYKKLYISLLYNYNHEGEVWSGHSPSVTSADLDNQNLVTYTFKRADYASKNFVYYSLKTNAVLDRDPESSSWDLLFTQYLTENYGTTTNQVVGGVLLNKGVAAIKVTGVDPEEFEDYDEDLFSEHINTVGYDWKSLNYSNFQWEITENTVYIIKDRNEDIWKFYFTGFGGSANGNHTFVKEKISSPTAINFFKQETSSFALYPNPVTNGVVNVVLQSQQVGVLEIYTSTGERIMSEPITNNQKTLSIAHLAQGMYWVQMIEEGNKTNAQKLIVQ